MPYEFIALEEDDASAIANPEQLQQVLQDDAGRYLDFSAALNEDCLDTEQVHRQTMQSVLRVCYWSLFFLGWVGVPFVQGILLSSEFSLRCAPSARERPLPPARSRSRLTAAIGRRAAGSARSLRCGSTASTTSCTCWSRSRSWWRWPSG